MFDWRDKFTEKVLNSAKKHVDNVYDVEVKNDRVTANVKTSREFNVNISLDDGKIKGMSCNCKSKSYCSHMAAVLYYMEENSLVVDSELKEIIDTMDETTLKEYVCELLGKNRELKEEFLLKFKGSVTVDEDKFVTKLELIISSSESRDYYSPVPYDVNSLSSGVFSFLIDEVSYLMDIKQYGLIFKLLCIMGEALNNEYFVDEFSWYDACEEYLQVSYRLEDAGNLTDKQLLELDEYASFMRSHGVV